MVNPGYLKPEITLILQETMSRAGILPLYERTIACPPGKGG
jgi:hypothetical protein